MNRSSTFRTVLALVLIVLNLLVWGWLLLAGIDLIQYAEARNLPGHPSVAQRGFYLAPPVVMIGLTLALPFSAVLLKSHVRRWPLCVTLILVVPFLLAYTGGI